MRTLFLGLLLLAISFFGCFKDNDSGFDFSFSRFEVDFFSMDSLNLDSSINYLQNKYPLFFMNLNDVEFHKKNYLYNDLLWEFYNAVITTYPDLNDFEKKLKKLFLNYSYYYPIERYEVFSYVSSGDIENRILVTDSVAFIAIDCYLGKDYSAYLFSYPEYIRNYLKREFIISDLALGLARIHVLRQLDDLTYLGEILYQGKLCYLGSLFLPDEYNHSIMRYTNKELEWCKEHEKDIWEYYIEQDLLFSTSPDLVNRFVNDAPFSKFYTLIDNDSPGRTGCWMGWQIIDSYMKKNNVSIKELIETDAQTILKNAKYKP